MATSNEFKLVNIKSKKYFSYLNPIRPVAENMQKRIGFYYLVIESVSHIKDIENITDTIIDTEFCNLILGLDNDDAGIDAVFIDEELKTINLFNFKFRDTFSARSGQSINDTAVSMKFLTHIANEDTRQLKGRTKAYVDDIIDRLNSDEIWTTNLYMVSNENNSLPVDDTSIDGFKNLHGMNIVSINLNDIVDFMAKRPEDVSASILLDSSSVMSYEEDDLSSAKSYLIQASLIDLIRLTCSIPEMRTDYHLEHTDNLKNAKLDLGLLFDNVRGFLGETKYNENIIETLRKEPTKFFMYNNGLTMTAKSITAVPKNGNKKMLLTLSGFQIVNGGQTLRSIYSHKDKEFDDDKLAQANVLIRVFQTQGDSSLTNNIAEYTNSQNAISSADLKSVSSLQIQIEHLLKERDILYVRKVGDTGDDDIQYKHRISMEKMAQIIYSKLGYPDRATNQKKRLFEKYYEDIFERNLDLNTLPDYVEEYFKIHNAYSHSEFEGYDQKYFYMLYLGNRQSDIAVNIQTLERSLHEFRKGEGISDARKLIQSGLKIKLDESLQ